MSNESQPAAAVVFHRPASAREVPSAVGLLLAEGSGERPAGPGQIAEFIHFAGKRRLDLSRVWVAADAAGPGARILAAVLPAISPGHSMLLITGPQSGDVMRGLICAVCDHHGRADIRLAQSLLDPPQTALRGVFIAAGFAQIAELIYLQADLPRHVAVEPPPPGMRWESYSLATHDLFARTILRTYEKSLDCPVISGMRSIEDVIVGHKGSGEFLPALWQILVEGDQGIGVVLLNRILHADAMELVYLGIAPEARGRGLGQMLMRRAQQLTLADQRRRITLAVDSVNAPALRLYDRFGFRRFAAKIVMLRDLRRA